MCKILRKSIKKLNLYGKTHTVEICIFIKFFNIFNL